MQTSTCEIFVENHLSSSKFVYGAWSIGLHSSISQLAASKAHHLTSFILSANSYRTHPLLCLLNLIYATLIADWVVSLIMNNDYRIFSHSLTTRIDVGKMRISFLHGFLSLVKCLQNNCTVIKHRGFLSFSASAESDGGDIGNRTIIPCDFYCNVINQCYLPLSLYVPFIPPIVVFAFMDYPQKVVPLIATLSSISG